MRTSVIIRSEAISQVKEDSPLPAGYTMEQSITGYRRLLDSDGNLIIDDPACEDVQDKEMAIALFLSYIAEL